MSQGSDMPLSPKGEYPPYFFYYQENRDTTNPTHRVTLKNHSQNMLKQLSNQTGLPPWQIDSNRWPNLLGPYLWRMQWAHRTTHSLTKWSLATLSVRTSNWSQSYLGDNCQLVTPPKPATNPTVKLFFEIAERSFLKILMLFGKRTRVDSFTIHKYSLCDMEQVISILQMNLSGSMQCLLSACFGSRTMIEAWFLLLRVHNIGDFRAPSTSVWEDSGSFGPVYIACCC